MGDLFTLFFMLVRATFVLMTFVLVSAIVLARIPGSEISLDPFAAYTDVMPGQMQYALMQRGFNCQANISFRFDDSCTLTLQTGIFSAIQTTVTSGTGRIRRVVFTARDQQLTLGQLLLLWGRPEIAIYSPTANFRWRSLHIVAIPPSYDGHLVYSLPIKYVAFESVNQD